MTDNVRGRQTLILDADDTLWVNNQLFEQAIDDFLGWIEHPVLKRSEMRAVLDEVERTNTTANGYGHQVFQQSLVECFGRLNGRGASDPERQQIREFASVVIQDQVELLPGVAATLAELDRRHDLRLLTKGAEVDQQRKVDTSNLAGYFDAVHIVPEKNTGTYLDLLREHALDPARTWMIGNSPRSDILPARRAGLGAVYIPDEHPWSLEHAEVDTDDEKVLRLQSFAELIRHF